MNALRRTMSKIAVDPAKIVSQKTHQISGIASIDSSLPIHFLQTNWLYRQTQRNGTHLLRPKRLLPTPKRNYPTLRTLRKKTRNTYLSSLPLCFIRERPNPMARIPQRRSRPPLPTSTTLRLHTARAGSRVSAAIPRSTRDRTLDASNGFNAADARVRGCAGPVFEILPCGLDCEGL